MRKSRIPFLILFLLIPLLSVSCVQHTIWELAAAAGMGEEYRPYDQLIGELKELAELRPDVAEMHSLGKTYEGRDIWAIRVGIRNAGQEEPKPEILVVGCIHANEWITKEVVMYFAENLVKEEKAEEEIHSLLERADIWLVPVANPDGVVYSETQHRQWRKNRRAFGGDIYGVDPNRAYPHMWRLPGDTPDNPRGNGGRDDPRRRTFRGYPDLNDTSRPAEIQNEVLAILSLISDPERNFIMFLDYHSFSELVMYPPGYSRDPPPDEEAYIELASGMAKAINDTRLAKKTLRVPFRKRLSYLYSVAQAGRLYPEIVTGGSVDTTYYTYGLWSLAIELPPAAGKSPGRREALYLIGTGYRLPSSRILPTCVENWSGFIFACNWALEHDPPKVRTPNPKPRYESVTGQRTCEKCGLIPGKSWLTESIPLTSNG